MSTIDPDILARAQVRRAQKQDVESIGDLWVQLIDFHACLDPRFGVPAKGRVHYMRQIHHALHNDNYRVFVYEIAGQVAGYILGYIAENPPIFPSTHFGFIADLYVHPVYRRLGIGRQLVAALRAWFRSRHLTSVQLNVAHANPASQAFWRGQGSTEYLHHMWMPVDEESGDRNQEAGGG